ncbi:MAG TPA: hypothetical protein VNK26_03170 [Pyrinomonadaceae bacterium]|nr:hypothetical protein [Pyrinomonadaceae bacterium]
MKLAVLKENEPGDESGRRDLLGFALDKEMHFALDKSPGFLRLTNKVRDSLSARKALIYSG